MTSVHRSAAWRRSRWRAPPAPRTSGKGSAHATDALATPDTESDWRARRARVIARGPPDALLWNASSRGAEEQSRLALLAAPRAAQSNRYARSVLGCTDQPERRPREPGVPVL